MAGRPATLRINILADAKGVGRGVDEANGKLGRLGKSAGLAGAAVGAGLAVGAVAVGAFAVSAVNAASSVEQSFGAVESVFGKAAAEVKGYANVAATQLGLSKSAYAGLAATVGSQLQGMGKSQAESAKETQRLISTGADLAATFGGSVSDAVGAVGSLLRGERDPIERYGVAITAADVKARLAAEGNDKLTGAALKTAQANATLALLTKKTANAHGAFGRESNTLAGQQERLKAQFENVKATVGAGLLPVLTRTFTYVGSTIVPVAQRLATQLAARLAPSFKQVGAFVQANVLPVMRALGTFFLRSFVPALVAIYGRYLPAVKTAFGSIGKAVSDNRTTFAKLQGVLTTVGAVLRVVAPVIGTVMAVAFRTLGVALGTAIRLYARFIDVLDRVLSKVRAVSSAIKNSAVGKAVSALFSTQLAPMGVQLVGGTDSLRPGAGLATAALGDGALSLLARGSSTGSGGATVVENTYNIRVDGALDGPAVAEQIKSLLAAQARRLGPGFA